MRKSFRALCVAATLAFALLALAAVPALALNTHAFSSSFGSAGAGAGQVALASNSGVAVNSTTHDVYVADTGNARVDQFSSAGTFIRAWGWGVADGLPALETCALSCQAGIQGSGAGQFTTPAFVAVDNSAGASAGDVYVGDRGTNEVLKFTAEGAYISTNDGSSATAPVAGPFGALAGVVVDASGNVWVYDEGANMFEFTQNGSFVTDWNSGRGVIPKGIDVDSAGNLYVLTGSGSVEQFTSAGTDVGSVNGDASSPTGFALDRSSDEVYMDNSGSLIYHYASTCDAGGSCAALDTFGSEHLNGAAGLATDSSNHTVYAADTGNGRVAVFAPVTLPDVSTGQAGGATGTSATLEGTVNPDGTAITDCHFSYVDEAGYDPGEANPYAAGVSMPCASAPSGSTPEPVSADVTGLTPGTLYHFRLSATNSGGTVTGQDQSFSTGPTIDSTYATDATDSSVSLHAHINPRGMASIYHFEYGTTTGYGHSTPESASIGADNEDHTVTVHIQGLNPGTVYHYRVVATNTVVPAGLDGPDRTISTQAAGAGASTLPDNRGYELITPVNKGDGGLPPADIGGFQASMNGDALAYKSFTPFPGAPSGFSSDYLATRSANGWNSQDLTPPQTTAEIDQGSPLFYALSSDLSKALFEEGLASQPNPPLVSDEPPGLNLFIRDNTSSTYQLISQRPHFAGASPDLSHVVFASGAQLVPGALAGQENLYEWADGSLSLVDLIPPGSTPRCGPAGSSCIVSPEGAALGGGASANRLTGALSAVSRDGSKVIFQDASAVSNGQLFERENGETTVEVSASQKTNGTGPGGTDPAGPRFPKYWRASADDTRVFFTSCGQLTNDSTANSSEDGEACHTGGANLLKGSDLYVYDTGSDTLSDLTVDHNGDPFGADVQAVLGASADGSYVYFVANGVLATGASRGNCYYAEKNVTQAPEHCNLYVSHDGTTTFIARLNGEAYDEGAWYLYAAAARVTPDGRHLAFESTASPTGYDNMISDGSSSCGAELFKYDNVGLAGGPLCSEVYIYDAASNELRCVSCNPTGARPLGASHLAPIEEEGNRGEFHDQYLPHSLSEDGSRVFFESEDALVPGDVNGRVDVYEYESGHVHLISSGTSNEESRFLDASATGNDVFFITRSRLVGQDIDEAPDIYDARVDGGFPVTAPSSPACSAEACKPPPALPSTGSTPASLSASGGGNLTPVVTSSGGARPRALTRAQRLARALKICQRKPRRRRASCRARARRLYGPVGTRRSTKSAKGGK